MAQHQRTVNEKKLAINISVGRLPITKTLSRLSALAGVACGCVCAGGGGNIMQFRDQWYVDSLSLKAC
jgi:hypothetical protein